MNNTEIIRDRNMPPRLHVKPWDETVCSVIPLNTDRSMSFEPYQTADGYEYNWILTKKPERNVVQMAIETEGLDFFYQPPFKNLNPDGSTWEIGLTGRNVRPANANGSYAVYHKTASGDYTALGGKNYMAGKAFHDYRPRPIDAKGRWCWADLHYDLKRGIRQVTIPKWFLDQATYPIYHAAGLEFGYKVTGTTISVLSGYMLIAYSEAGGGDPDVPASSGVLDSIVAYLSVGTATGATFNPALYDSIVGVPTNRLGAVDSGGAVITLSNTWVETSIPGSVAITAAAHYWFGLKFLVSSGDVEIAYDAGGGETSGQYASVGAWPAIWSGSDWHHRLSVYGKYSLASSDGLFF